MSASMLKPSIENDSNDDACVSLNLQSIDDSESFDREVIPKMQNETALEKHRRIKAFRHMMEDKRIAKKDEDDLY